MSDAMTSPLFTAPGANQTYALINIRIQLEVMGYVRRHD
ncbi:hypothetical protein M2366_003803 [Aeromonas sp. BIGb0405]|jgi:hypothetical protein|nr:hypothetical protein [Aeromonas sp. BIGb0405]